ncbi:MAG: NAD(P)-dependent oxidoreductase [Luteolibacter sp.]|jgi:3-hydroxyisobutyrate dehydrogenase/glyoxylate/succinic semialdehyde reductase|nr:NAD(P)-dependent oxidoreductase [Luteolibacter sp.]
MSPEPSDRAAVLGLGIIGSRARSRLAAAGWSVACWNRTPRGMPGETDTPEQAIHGAAVISFYLKDAPAVREVIGRIEAFLKPGRIVMNHSTVDLETTRWLEKRCLARGCRFLDAPFTGSRLAAGDGQLVYYIGGEPALAAELDAYLSVTSKARLPCGPVGAATVVKLATNLISACTVQALAEALAIATHHGVPAQCLVDAVSQNVSASALSAMKFPAMLAGNYETHFSLSNMGKDSRYMLALADSAGLETPAITAVSRRLTDLCDAGLGELDYSALAKPYLRKS